MMIQVVKVLCRTGPLKEAAHIPLSRVQVGNDRRFEHYGTRNEVRKHRIDDQSSSRLTSPKFLHRRRIEVGDTAPTNIHFDLRRNLRIYEFAFNKLGARLMCLSQSLMLHRSSCMALSNIMIGT